MKNPIAILAGFTVGFLVLFLLCPIVLAFRLLLAVYATLEDWTLETWELAKDIFNCVNEEAKK